MKLNAYAIFDDKAMRFMRPFFIPTHGEAIRSFGSSVKDPNGLAYQHPGDFKLYHIGSFNEETALLESLSTPPTCLAQATDFHQKPENEKIPVVNPELLNGRKIV